MNTFTTPKGTELPLQDLKGKDYLQPMYRIVWLREEHPLWTIHTEIISHDKQSSLVYAKVLDETGRLISSAHKEAGGEDFHLEKAETGAIGRALAHCGYGTAFAALELDEGSVVVDSPATKRVSHEQQNAKNVHHEQQKPKFPDQSVPGKGGPGAYVLKMGPQKKNRLDSLLPKDIASYVTWLRTKAPPAVRDSQSGKNDLFACELYLRSQNVTQTEAELFGNHGSIDNGAPPDFKDEPWPDSAYDMAKNN